MTQLGDGSHIRPRNETGPRFEEKERRKQILKDNMNLYGKISAIMTRQTFEYQNKKVRLFPRPSWRGRTVDKEDLSSSRLNYNVTKT